jgi:1-acyl-sn-glycerol-3-phosphate acyltransferase
MSLLVSAYFLLLFQAGLMLLAAVSFIFLPFGQGGRRLFYRIFKYFLRFLLLLCFIRIKVSGEKIGRELRGAILAGNHPGLLEPMYLIAALPVRLVLVADTGILKIPFLGRVLATAGCLTYEKGGRDIGFMIAMRETLERGDNLMVFPPALRRHDTDLSDFDDALVRTALLCRAAIVPFLVKQPSEAALKKGYFVTPGQVEIVVGKTLKPRDREEVVTLDHLFRTLMEG